MPEDIHHPLFARCFDRLNWLMEPEIGHRRDQLLADLTGRVLKVGAGTGISFAHYPPSVSEVVAVEPEPYMRAKAEQAAAASPLRVTVTSGVAERLDFATDSFDAAVACLVLCSVRSTGSVLAELVRVVKPRGELRFFEHVRSPRPAKARLQRLADGSGLWPRFGGGCHAARDSLERIEAAGFRVASSERFDVGPRWAITNPHVLGRAILPGNGGEPAG